MTLMCVLYVSIIFSSFLNSGAQGERTNFDFGSPDCFRSFFDNSDVLRTMSRFERKARIVIPEAENASAIATGLPGTRFQPTPVQNIADVCVNVTGCDSRARYRSINGSCNNLRFPMWGLTGTALVRLLPAAYQDVFWLDNRVVVISLPDVSLNMTASVISETLFGETSGNHRPRVSVTGRALPRARDLRLKVLPTNSMTDRINSLTLMQWGQLISHDTTHISVLPVTNLGGLECCQDGIFTPELNLPSDCMPMLVDTNDPYYSQFNQTCLNFVRSPTTNSYGCNLSPQQQLAMVTHFVDASFLYGSSDRVAESLRTRCGGLLKFQRTKDFRVFPPNVLNATRYCEVTSNKDTCYYAGDSRVNQNTDVTVMHVLFLREHNNLCRELRHINPHWDDERLYQEARRIVVAAVQRITYTNFISLIIGEEYSRRIGILDSEFPNLYDGYEPLLNPTSVNDFTTASYRGFHSLVPSNIKLVKEGRCPRASVRLSDWLFRPSILQSPGNFDDLVRGLATQESLIFNRFFSNEISNELFRIEAPFGTDLAATDIQRGRDHGLPSYNSYRNACGLPRAEKFNDFSDVMDLEYIELLRMNYEDIEDVEVYVAGLLERPVEGALTGPTFACLNAEQFVRWRNGDRFFYTFSGQSGSFTPAQYIQLQRLSLALIYCRNGDNIKYMQPNVFQHPSTTNLLVPCDQILAMDLTPWKEIT